MKIANSFNLLHEASKGCLSFITYR